MVLSKYTLLLTFVAFRRCTTANRDDSDTPVGFPAVLNTEVNSDGTYSPTIPCQDTEDTNPFVGTGHSLSGKASYPVEEAKDNAKDGAFDKTKDLHSKEDENNPKEQYKHNSDTEMAEDANVHGSNNLFWLIKQLSHQYTGIRANCYSEFLRLNHEYFTALKNELFISHVVEPVTKFNTYTYSSQLDEIKRELEMKDNSQNNSYSSKSPVKEVLMALETQIRIPEDPNIPLDNNFLNLAATSIKNLEKLCCSSKDLVQDLGSFNKEINTTLEYIIQEKLSEMKKNEGVKTTRTPEFTGAHNKDNQQRSLKENAASAFSGDLEKADQLKELINEAMNDYLYVRDKYKTFSIDKDLESLKIKADKLPNEIKLDVENECKKQSEEIAEEFNDMMKELDSAFTYYENLTEIIHELNEISKQETVTKEQIKKISLNSEDGMIVLTGLANEAIFTLNRFNLIIRFFVNLVSDAIEASLKDEEQNKQETTLTENETPAAQTKPINKETSVAQKASPSCQRRDSFSSSKTEECVTDTPGYAETPRNNAAKKDPKCQC
ncbi:hypothetical protein ENBRE01_3016 [Enteropsectra breve]|nr:hypothetical protein ENBRE01_3016 [Enteropsectra breve]